MPAPTLERAFGEQLRTRRKAAGLSQLELSLRADLHWTYISQLERGLKSPSLGVLFALSGALAARPSEMVKAVEAAISDARPD